ncbi:MAG: hypothetical protein GX113_02250 [Actinobacteria bacterium]|nr:hypothetical protein [Actinomycetota bacterium]
MSKRERRDGDRDRWSDRRDNQPEDEQQRRSGEAEAQESDSLAALKVILSKVAALLKPLQLNQEESIRLVEQLYGSVLDMDVKLAGEADDTRKSSVLSHIQNTTISRDGNRLIVEFPATEEQKAKGPAAKKSAATQATAAAEPATGTETAAKAKPATKTKTAAKSRPAAKPEPATKGGPAAKPEPATADE